MDDQNINKSGILPTGGHILVIPKKVEEITSGGIILPEEIREKEQQAATEGILIAVGEDSWTDVSLGPWAEVGDKVSYSRYAGVSMVGADGETYVLLNDVDILARLLF